MELRRVAPVPLVDGPPEQLAGPCGSEQPPQRLSYAWGAGPSLEPVAQQSRAVRPHSCRRAYFFPAAIATALLSGSACRYWSGGEQAGKSREVARSSTEVAGDDWLNGRLPPTDPKQVPRQGGEIVVRVHYEPPSLNGISDADWLAAQITENRIYESLVVVDPYDHPTYRLLPGLAERWAISGDRLRYTFWLRRHVSFHDGQPFTARDVLATFDKVQDPSTKAVHKRAYTKELVAYRALDDYTVEFEFRAPYFMVMDGVFADIQIQPAHIIEPLSGREYNESATNPLNRLPIGTGPFRFDSWITNQRISLTRYGEYWGRAPYLSRVTFRIVKDSTIALELAARREVDVVTRLFPEQWIRMDRATLASDYYRVQNFESNYTWIGYNESRRMFQDARVRRALTQLIDRDGIIRSLQHGLARATTCQFHIESPACDQGIVPLAYDPVTATAILESAGWRLVGDERVRSSNGERFAFTLLIPAGSEDTARAANVAKQSLERAGIEMRLQRVEWSVFMRRLREHDFDACTMSWADGSPRSDPTQIWHSSSSYGGSNFIGYNSGRADALMDAARQEFDDGRRNELYREFGRILYEDQPYTWLYVRPRLDLIHRRVQGARASLSGWRYEDWWVVGDRVRGKAHR